MKVISKFLTAEVRITKVTLAGRKIVVEGMVKELLPMTVELSADDVRTMVLAVAAPLRERLAQRLPARLAALVAPPPDRPTP